MFDFANQAYTLLIITVIYGDLFTRIIVGDGGGDYRLGNLLWSTALALSYLGVVATAPWCGAVMDYAAAKKRFLFISYITTVAATAALYWVEPGYIVLGFVLIVISNYAYSMGEAFIAGFLPDIAGPSEMGRVSGLGWSLGYIGGLCATLFTVLILGEVSEENFDRIRWVGPFAAVFFLLCAIPTFLWLRERGRPRPLPSGCGYARLGFGRVAQTLRNLKQLRELALFLVSLLLATSGLVIVIAYAFIYGAQVIGWDEHVRMVMFITTQVAAAAGAIGFGLIQDRLGAKRTYMVTLLMWIAAILMIWGTPGVTEGVNRLLGLAWEAQYVFLFAGCLAGLALGSCQSAGRTIVGLFAPDGRAGEFFGFWGLATRLAGAIGLVAVGGLQILLGLQGAILLCAGLFIGAFVVALRVDEQRGRVQRNTLVE
ncbi:MFS transporter [Halorhodospira abdelmalekii]|uniref:MFS transporter n=1 Tax=Halorhodospira abdelmalekii TaxID=421629 RepID=UPI001906CE14|nr:MFS transporter [Halorhodospira abdelmalekii]MBK1734334.1 MFS transporter [Halorhodospira abdelmalekii]